MQQLMYCCITAPQHINDSSKTLEGVIHLLGQLLLFLTCHLHQLCVLLTLTHEALKGAHLQCMSQAIKCFLRRNL